MNIARTNFEGVFLIELQPHVDERGSFTRVFSLDVFRTNDLCTSYPEHSVAQNGKLGVLRGLHYQASPYDEVKVVRCSLGRVFDVLVDLRPSSKTYGQWLSFLLDAAKQELVYVPAGVAHGYQTLSEISHMEYLISEKYHPEAARGIRWDSETLAIPWPIANPVMSDRDRTHPIFLP